VIHDVTNAVLFLVGRVLYYLLWPLLQAMDVLFHGLRSLLVSVFGQGERPQEPPPSTQDLPEGTRSLPGWVDAVLRVGIIAAVIGVLVVVVAFLFRRFRKPPRPQQARESVYEEGRLVGDLGDLLGALVGRLRPSFGRGPHLEPIRRLYHDMLTDAADVGVIRESFTTPLELAPRLEQRFGSAVPARISLAFDAARYGGRVPSDADVRGLRSEWESVRRSVD
jgi:Domain of unknown function (DUF4129)